MIGLFQTLLRPDREEDPERTIVARAANILQVGEFQLLQLAYEDWYGKAMSPELSDRLFRAYMMQGEVPVWARHYARWVIRQDEIDAGFDGPAKRDSEIHHQPPPPPRWPDAVEIEIHADLADPAERKKDEFRLRFGLFFGHIGCLEVC